MGGRSRTFTCDGTPSADLVRLGEGLVQAELVSVAAHDGGAAVLLRDNGVPEDGVRSYVQRLGADGVAGEPLPLPAGFSPVRMVALDGSFVAALSSADTLVIVAWGDDAPYEVERHALDGAVAYASMAVGSEAHLAWSDHEDHVHTLTIGESPQRLLDGGSPVVQAAAFEDRWVVLHAKGDAVRLYENGDEILALPFDTDASGVGLRSGGRGVAWTWGKAVPFDLDEGTNGDAFETGLLGWMPRHIGGDTWMFPGELPQEDVATIAFHDIR